MKKIRTTRVAFDSMLHGKQTYDGPSISLEKEEIVDAEPNGSLFVDGRSEDTMALYLRTWKDGGMKNYSPGVSCTVHVLERDLEKEFPDLVEKVRECKRIRALAPDPDMGSCS